jgi:uncharacterized protein YtpQ (UPF0354 family)
MKTRLIKINKADQANLETEVKAEKLPVKVDQKESERKITININNWIKEYQQEKRRSKSRPLNFVFPQQV